jgi:endogenous inhibitor of DNA gyrase (YacG/DUF329 family)
MTSMVLKKCPNCGTVLDTELLRSYNSEEGGLGQYKERHKKIKCPKCDQASNRGLWESVR